MKKIYFSAVIMLLALSVNAFAQINQPTTYLQFPKSEPLGKIRVSPADRLLNKTFNFSDNRSAKPFKNKLKELNVSIQLNDSIYDYFWDTTNLAWYYGYKTIKIVYDADNNLTSRLAQHWNGSAWENSYQNAYTYDANKNLTSELFQMYSWDSLKLENFSNITYTYDAHNNKTSYMFYGWYDTVWVKNMQTIYTYDANDNLASESWEGSWTTTTKYLFTYDINNNMTKYLGQTMNGSDWVNYLQGVYTYDANNNQTSYLEQNWNGSAWVNSWKDTLTYDANNTQTSYLTQNWDGSTWINSYLRTSAYDANNNRISDLAQNWIGSAWVNLSKNTLTYDANNNQTSYFGQNWNGSAWVNYLQQSATYDINNFTLSQLYKYWNSDGTKVTSGDSTYYYFHTVVTGIENPDKSGISVYPNPTNGKFTISGKSSVSTIEIYNLSGERVYSDFKSQKQTSSEIDLSGYAKGIYLLKIIDGTKIQSRKVVVQ